MVLYIYIVTDNGLVWLIIMGYELDDWIYWHFFTITVNYNSSHIELLLNDVCLTNLSEESLKFTNELPFITATRTEYKSPCRTLKCPLLFCVIRCSGNTSNSSPVCCHGNLLPGKDSFIAILCSGNVISEPLLSNGHLLRLHHSGFQLSCDNIHGQSIVLFCY
jgi:hypothetical protein